MIFMTNDVLLSFDELMFDLDFDNLLNYLDDVHDVIIIKGIKAYYFDEKVLKK